MMDRIYRKHGIQREDYHKRKFSGRPLKRIKENAVAIFSDAKAMLKELKDPSVDDAFIDDGCDEVISLLTSSLAMIDALLKKDATLEDVAPAKEKIDEYVKIFKASTITGDKLTVKLHVLKDHGAQCLKNHIVAGLPLHLSIEQFVERNHQEGKKLDEQMKRIVSSDTMTNKMAKVKALDSNGASTHGCKLTGVSPRP